MFDKWKKARADVKWEQDREKRVEESRKAEAEQKKQAESDQMERFLADPVIKKLLDYPFEAWQETEKGGSEGTFTLLSKGGSEVVIERDSFRPTATVRIFRNKIKVDGEEVLDGELVEEFFFWLQKSPYFVKQRAEAANARVQEAKQRELLKNEDRQKKLDSL